MAESMGIAKNSFNKGSIVFFERVLITWLLDPRVTIACGHWDGGAIMELVPRGKVRMLPANYGGCFAGVRELRLDGSKDHLHIDLGRIHSIEYAIRPNVCFGFRPSLEVRFTSLGPGGARTGRVALTALLSSLYAGSGIQGEQVRVWLERYLEHVRNNPQLVRLVVDPSVRDTRDAPALLDVLRELSGNRFDTWSEAIEFLTRHERPAARPELPAFKTFVEDALQLPDASLVIFRDRTLVEFKTEELGGLFEYRDGDHVSWQIGRYDNHHCHLALSAVTAVEFSAEPVPCQGGRLNYTVWFLVSGGCGNPFRPAGYFSVVLNRPYEGDAPRWLLISHVFELYERHRHHGWVRADQGFLEALAHRRALSDGGHQCLD